MDYWSESQFFFYFYFSTGIWCSCCNKFYLVEEISKIFMVYGEYILWSWSLSYHVQVSHDSSVKISTKCSDSGVFACICFFSFFSSSRTISVLRCSSMNFIRLACLHLQHGIYVRELSFSLIMNGGVSGVSVAGKLAGVSLKNGLM